MIYYPGHIPLTLTTPLPVSCSLTSTNVKSQCPSLSPVHLPIHSVTFLTPKIRPTSPLNGVPKSTPRNNKVNVKIVLTDRRYDPNPTLLRPLHHSGQSSENVIRYIVHYYRVWSPRHPVYHFTPTTHLYKISISIILMDYLIYTCTPFTSLILL